MNQKKIIVDSPFTPAEILVRNKIVELSSFSISRGRQSGKSQYCLKRSIDNLSMTFQVCRWFKSFSLGLSIFGLLITILPILLQRSHWKGMGSLMVCGVLFSISGVFILVNQKKIVFDRLANECRFTNSVLREGIAIKLDSIIGIQLIESMENSGTSTENHSNWKRKYYELNVVIENMERINLFKMTNLQATTDMVNELHKFLKKPLWWVEIAYKTK